MKNVFVYCEVTEERTIADVSLELLSKGKKLAQQLGVKLEAVVLGDGIEGLEKEIIPFGADIVHMADSPELFPYRTLPHA
ncbi:MAG: electron transfer flavoprotein subunit alpha, partial [Bacteroidales bacterium]|nr:electron transfer flavoprotein subunit alpha [Bacteroidales bacterium]